MAEQNRALFSYEDLGITDEETARVITVYAARVLLLQKGGTTNPGVWELPEGHIDPTDYSPSPVRSHEASVEETLAVAATRELREETGIRIDSSELLPIPGVYGYSSMTPKGEITRLIHGYVAVLATPPVLRIGQTLKPDGTPEDNHLRAGWFNSEAVMTLPSGPLALNSIDVLRDFTYNFDY